MDKQTSRKIIVCTIFFLTVGLLLAVTSVWALDTIPMNGDFNGNSNGWVSTAGSYTGSGRTNGGFQLGSILSSPVTIDSSGSVISWYDSANADVHYSVYLIDYTTGGKNQLRQIDIVAQGWTNKTYTDTASYVGHKVALLFHFHYGNNVYIDDVTISNATNYLGTTGSYINGSLQTSAVPWVNWNGGGGNVWTSNSRTADGTGAFKLQNDGSLQTNWVSIPFTGGSTWTMYFTGGSNARIVASIWDYTNNTTADMFDTQQNWAGWIQKTYTMTAYAGHTVSIVLKSNPNWSGDVTADEICPAAGCLGQWQPTPTPTFTPAPTASLTPSGGGGFPYGIGTPIPVDWQNFPTAIPYPTNQPYPTSMYGLGTPQPVIMFGGSPVPIQGGNTTPVLITGTVNITGVVRIDDRTPVSVRIAPDPLYTAVPYSQVVGQVSQASPGQGYALPTMIYEPSESTIQLGQSGSSVNPVRFVMSQSDITTPSVSFPPLGVNFNVVIHYMYPTEFVIAGIDLLGGLYGLGAVFLLVFVFRQIQEK